MPITHSKVSSVPDGADATLVRPSDWNADHTGSPAELDDHLADAADAHDASAISFADNTDNFSSTNVEDVIPELWDLTSGQLIGALQGHSDDNSDAHNATGISIIDAAGDFTATEVEGALAELQSDNEAHVAAADPHTGYVKENDANWTDLTDSGATTLHSHAGAPTDADYLVGTANGNLSAEIAVGTSPGGELGGTWASPTVDATHAGTTHSAATDTHIADSSAAHAASAVSFSATGTIAATDVQAAIAEVASEAANPVLTSAKYTRTSANYTTTSTSFVDVDATNMALTITTGARRVLIGFVGTTAGSGTSDTQMFDVDLDGARLGGAFGLMSNRMATATHRRNSSFTYLTDVLTAGSHTFKLQWFTSASTATMFGTAASDSVATFFVQELA